MYSERLLDELKQPRAVVYALNAHGFKLFICQCNQAV
jgi:hypothetical protein